MGHGKHFKKQFMKKIILLLSTVLIFSFQTQEVKNIKFEFTPNEVELIYTGLGKLPAEQVEGLRQKIAIEYRKQLSDTTTKKKLP